MNAPMGECWALKPRWQESGADLVTVVPRSEFAFSWENAAAIFAVASLASKAI
jgi:hypothetical protein